MAIRAESCLFAPTEDVIEVPPHVARNDKVQASIIVIVDPCGACHPSRAPGTRTGCYIRECAIPIVVIERAVAISSNIEIFKTIVVGIAHRNACGISESGEASLLSYIF